MSILNHFWDDTVAGPQPEHGVGKLRKPNTFASGQNTSKAELDAVTGKSYGKELTNEATKITRKIMIIKPPVTGTQSPPISPAGSTPPASPFSGSGGGREQNSRFRRRSTSDVHDRRESIRLRSPTSPHDV